MKRSEVKIDVYLDTPQQKRELRSVAGKANMSMNAFAKAILQKALISPLFLATLYDESNEDIVLSNERVPSHD